MIRETRLRSLLKSLSWRSAGTLVSTVIVFFVTRRWTLALAVGGVDATCKIALFFLHERLWDKIRFGKHPVEPAVIWLTGLPGSGKSTLAALVADAIRAKGLRAETLDGDSLRELLPQTGFSRSERESHIRRTALLARYLEKNGVFPVVSLISPYEESRRFARGLCRNFIEVHVATPLEVCEKRDPKGLYAKARRGELKDFTGVDAPYEIPVKPEIRVDTSRMSAEQAAGLILKAAERFL